MGFKKGRAARAAAKVEAASEAMTSGAMNIWNDGGSCVHYTASNGSEYKIDVATMEQTNVRKGTTRIVHRRRIPDTNWIMWQFESTRPERSRMRTASDIAYIQYPKFVGFALDERWRHFESIQSESGRQSVSEKAIFEAWTRVVGQLDDSAFASIFNGSDNCSETYGPGQEACEALSRFDNQSHFDVSYATSEICTHVAADAALQQVMFDRLMRTELSPQALAHAIRWLLRRGLKASAAHCRKIAFSCGSLAALRVLIVEARVDVCGLDLLDSGASSSGKHASAGHGGWIQHSKHAVKLLLARGAVLGGHGSKSKLLKKLEVDGDILWARRILDAMGEVFPEFVLVQLGKFLGVSVE